MGNIENEISAALMDGDEVKVKELVEAALVEGISADDILKKGLLPAMDVIAVKFKNNEVYVPEVLMSAQAMNEGTALLKPFFAGDAIPAIGTAILGTVRGDLHDIGKNLVRMLFEGKGIKVLDLGVDVTPEKFLLAYKAEKADVIALSALLTTTMGEMKSTIDVFVEAGVRDEVVFIIGGAPVTEIVRDISGADIYREDAASGAEAAADAILAKK